MEAAVTMKINAIARYYNTLNDNDRTDQTITVSGDGKQTSAMGMDILELSQNAFEMNTRKKDSSSDNTRKMAKALEIARRIAKGGHVPRKDESFLIEYNAELYFMAKQQAMEAKKHEKYDSVDKDGRFRTAESTSADVTISADAAAPDDGDSAE